MSIKGEDDNPKFNQQGQSVGTQYNATGNIIVVGSDSLSLSADAINFLKQVYECYIDHTILPFTYKGKKISSAARGYQHGYNLDFEEGLIIKCHGFLGSLFGLMSILERTGVISSEDESDIAKDDLAVEMAELENDWDLVKDELLGEELVISSREKLHKIPLMPNISVTAIRLTERGRKFARRLFPEIYDKPRPDLDKILNHEMPEQLEHKRRLAERQATPQTTEELGHNMVDDICRTCGCSRTFIEYFQSECKN